MEHPIDESENRDRGQTRLQHRDDDDLRAVAFEDIDFKKFAALNAINAKATSERKSVPSMILCGITFRQHGPIKMPASI